MALSSVTASKLKAFASALLLAWSASAHAVWPERPIRVVVPYPAGQGADVLMRHVAQELGTRLGQAVVIENRAGAGTNIGNEFVARAEPDGYTLLCTGNAIAVNHTLYKKLSYDARKDLAGVGLLARIPLIVLATPSSGMTSIDDLVASAKAAPGKIAYGVAGAGGTQHLAGEMLKMMAGIDLAMIPYKGSSPAQVDFLGGQFPVLIDSITSALPLIQSRRAVPLAVTSAARAPQLPNVPAVREAKSPGLKEFDASSWLVVFAPARTPPDIVARLNREISAIMSSPAMVETFRNAGAEPATATPAETNRFVAGEISKWAPMVRATGLSLD